MKNNIFFLPTLIIFNVSVLFLSGCIIDKSEEHEHENDIDKNHIEKEVSKRQLRHVVLFKFKEEASSVDIRKVEQAFKDLPSKIPQIRSFEFGTNNSPEGLDKGFTHCFFLTFDSEEDRAIYLPHPDHKAFGALLGPYLEDVLVLDYWTE